MSLRGNAVLLAWRRSMWSCCALALANLFTATIQHLWSGLLCLSILWRRCPFPWEDDRSTVAEMALLGYDLLKYVRCPHINQSSRKHYLENNCSTSSTNHVHQMSFCFFGLGFRSRNGWWYHSPASMAMRGLLSWIKQATCVLPSTGQKKKKVGVNDKQHLTV
jgi:hypothetical protein